VAPTEEDRLKILELLSRDNLAADEEGVEVLVADFADDGVIEGFYGSGRGEEAMRRDLPAKFSSSGSGIAPRRSRARSPNLGVCRAHRRQPWP
jgi:hypothetical protein